MTAHQSAGLAAGPATAGPGLRPRPRSETARPSRPVRGLAVALALAGAALLLGACTSDDDTSEARLVEGYAGFAAADEPRAALVGREILANNGSAADAVVAMAFTMTATLPSRVGLGGGGVCVVSDRSEETVEAVRFLPRRAPAGGSIPALARGLAAVHAGHGVRDWREVVSPAERYARFGHLVSDALRADLEDGADRLSGEARERFLGADGSLPAVGQRLSHPALSAVLSGIRQQGAGYLYAGQFANRLAEAARQAGQPFEVEALSGYAVQAGETLTVPFGNHRVHLPPPPATGGLLAGQTWGMLREARDAAPDLDGDSAHLLAEAWKRSLSRTGRWLAQDADARPQAQELLAGDALAQAYRGIDAQAATPAGRLSPPPPKKSAGVPTAGAVAADRFGNLASCTFTMNALFGSGADAIGTGVLLAQPAPAAAAGADMLPVVIANEFTGRGYLALSGAGGADGVLAAAELIRKLEAVNPEEVDLARNLALPRLYHPGKPDELQVEPTLPEAARQRLRTMGHTVVTRPGMGRLQAIYCPDGANASGAGCQVAADPRGDGLGVRAQ